jgi:hypothetical protein
LSIKTTRQNTNETPSDFLRFDPFKWQNKKKKQKKKVGRYWQTDGSMDAEIKLD